MQPSRLGPGRSSLLCLGCQGRNSAIWGIDDDRRPKRGNDLPSTIPPEIVVASRQICLGIAIAPVGIIPLSDFLLECSCFLRSEESFAGHVGRPLERGDRGICPYTLKIPWLYRPLLTGSKNRDQQDNRNPCSRSHKSIHESVLSIC